MFQALTPNINDLYFPFDGNPISTLFFRFSFFILLLLYVILYYYWPTTIVLQMQKRDVTMHPKRQITLSCFYLNFNTTAWNKNEKNRCSIRNDNKQITHARFHRSVHEALRSYTRIILLVPIVVLQQQRMPLIIFALIKIFEKQRVWKILRL